MLPRRLRLWLFDRLSVKTMRYVTAVPRKKAKGLTKRVYDMIEDDFFINGSLTSRSSVPPLMAAIWTSGRETMLVDDQLDRTTKEAICGVLSDLNDCPYCGDMLVSLVDAGKEHDAAAAIHRSGVGEIENPRLREQLQWVEAAGTPGQDEIPPCPFDAEQLPEVLGSLMAMADINRFSHVVMDGSPVNLPFGLQRPALRLFGRELVPTKAHAAEPGRALALLPEAPLPADLAWANPNPRIADALARWTAAVERETAGVIPAAVRERVERSLSDWRNEQMPLSRSWVETDVAGLEGEERAIARLAILLAKAPHQVSDDIVEGLTGDERRFVRILAWCSFTASRRFIATVHERLVTAPAAKPEGRAGARNVCARRGASRIVPALLAGLFLVPGCDDSPTPRIRLEAPAVAPDSVTLSWSRIGKAALYVVTRDGREVGTTDPGDRRWTEDRLQPDREYRFRVTALGTPDLTGARVIVGESLTIRVRTRPRDDWEEGPLGILPPVSTVVVDADGARHLLHARPGVGIVHSTERDGSWTSEPIAPGTRPALAVEPGGGLAAAFVQAGALWSARENGGWWTTELVDVGPLDAAADVEIAASPDGSLHIAYVVTDRGVHHATNETGGWLLEPIGRTPMGLELPVRKLAIAATEHVHVFSLVRGGIYELVREAGLWTEHAVASHAEGDFDAAIDHTGTLHVAYYDYLSIRYHARDEFGWWMERIDASPDDHCTLSLALDRFGAPHVAYHAGDGHLKYATRTGSAWSTASLHGEADACRETRIAVDRNGVIHVVFAELGDGELRLFRGRPITEQEPSPVDRPLSIRGGHGRPGSA